MALTIALVSFMESIAVAKAIQIKHRDYKVIPNQELISLGLANVFGSFFQSFPTTGGFSRTAVNDQAGAKTGLAAIISALLIVVTLLFLTPLFYNLPKTILASVIMVAVFGLIDYKEAIHLWKSNRTDFFLLVVTFIATLTIGIEKGIGLGVILSLAMVIFKTTRPYVAVLAKIPGTHFYRNIERFEGIIRPKEDVLIVRFDAQLYFANTAFFKDKLEDCHDIKISYETLRQLLIKKSKHQVKTRRKKYRRRRRMPKAGMLMQMDSSQHRWIESIEKKEIHDELYLPYTFSRVATDDYYDFNKKLDIGIELLDGIKTDTRDMNDTRC